MKKADITFNNGTFLLSGELDHANVMSVYQKSLADFSRSQQLQFDFSALRSSDSSGLALIIEWMKLAKQHNQSIQFKALSSDLLSIAKIAGLEEMVVNA